MNRRPALWAPWRGVYVEGPKGRSCIFCEPPKPIPDRERLLLYRSECALVLLNRYPYAPGHLMVAPRAHVARLPDLPPEAQHELMRCVTISQRILEEAYEPDGMNIGANFGSAAGAGFADHLHLHVVPRWEGDTNFMTVVGDLRVISRALDEIYDALVLRFAEVDR